MEGRLRGFFAVFRRVLDPEDPPRNAPQPAQTDQLTARILHELVFGIDRRDLAAQRPIQDLRQRVADDEAQTHEEVDERQGDRARPQPVARADRLRDDLAKYKDQSGRQKKCGFSIGAVKMRRRTTGK